MTNKTFKTLLSSGLLFLLAAGCAHHQPESASNSSPTLTPTSAASSQGGAYTATVTAPGGASGTLTAASPSASPEDQKLGESIRQMIMADNTLAPYPSQVTAIMDPASPGTVILSGSVPTDRAKRKLQARVAAMDGVKRVENRLLIGEPDKLGEFDPNTPAK